MKTKTNAAVEEKLCQSAPKDSLDIAASQFSSDVAKAQKQTHKRYPTEINTTGVCTFLILLAPKIFIPTINDNIIITA